MNNWFVSINRDEIYPIVQKALEYHGISVLDDDKWYPQQLSLDIFKSISEQKADAGNHLMALGLAYVETATFPLQISSTLSALLALPATYHLNIRNIPQAEGYETRQLTNIHIQIKDLNPFPHYTVYGFILGIAKRFRTLKAPSTVINRTFFNQEEPDADGALYDVFLDQTPPGV